MTGWLGEVENDDSDVIVLEGEVLVTLELDW